MTDELVVIEKQNIPIVFKKDGMNPFIDKIKQEAENFKGDISTDKGRKKIASFAHKIARSKTYLDSLGKELVAGIKEQSKTIDAERKRMRDELDDLKISVRKELTEWENKEKQRVLNLRSKIDYIESFSEFYESGIINEVKEKIDLLEKIQIDSGWKEFEELASKTKTASLLVLKSRLVLLDQREKELLQKQKEEAERIENERIEREKRIADEAAEKARIETIKKAEQDAADKIAEEKRRVDEAKEAEIKAILNAERAEQAKQDVILSAKREAKQREIEKQEEAKRVKFEKLEAFKKAEKEKQDAIKAERDRVERKRIQLEREDKARADDLNHRKDFNNQSKNAFIESGFDNETAIKIVKLIASGKIPNISIKY